MAGLRRDSAYSTPRGLNSRMVRGMARKFGINTSLLGRWTLGANEGETETDLEVFSGIGFYSRPRAGVAGDDAEVITLSLGAKGENKVIVATRDEGLRQILTAIKDMLNDEVAIFNSSARVHILADGTVEIDDGSGAVVLAKGDHTHGPGSYAAGGDAVTGTSGGSSSNTTILKGK